VPLAGGGASPPGQAASSMARIKSIGTRVNFESDFIDLLLLKSYQQDVKTTIFAIQQTNCTTTPLQKVLSSGGVNEMGAAT
jgi:hypothetical protein